MVFELFVLILPTNIFLAGLGGLMLWRKNLISLLISLEVIFLSVNLGFILASLVIDDMAGVVLSMSILTMAGIEVSVGLAIIILIYRRHGTINVSSITKVKA
jgi:NADH-quinone oxidoreductase subunit K